MFLRILIALIILVAIGAGLTASVWRDQLLTIAMIRSFFDISVPILGFGALIKYLCTCSHCCAHKED